MTLNVGSTTEFRLQHSLSTDNHSDPAKDNDLAIFLQDKARKSEGEEAEVYSGFTQRKKFCPVKRMLYI